MRGLAAHSNGFQTVRALAVLMSICARSTGPSGFLHKAPYPRHIVPNYRTIHSPAQVQPNTPLPRLSASPRIRTSSRSMTMAARSASTRASRGTPLSAHGLMHNVITKDIEGDPYRLLDTLCFMANMAWNSTMNTMAVREMLNAKDATGRVPTAVPRGV